MSIKKKKCTLVILNYNGKELLKECMPSILDAAKFYDSNSEVILLDNASSDDSVSFVRDNFKDVCIEEVKVNNFLFSYNNILKKLSCEYAILMNNDVIFSKDFIAPLLRHFDDPDVFAVGPRIYNIPGNKLFKGQMVPNFSKFWFCGSYVPDVRNACFTFSALATTVVVDRRKFGEIGGFDELFKPGYAEDDDLCYRAWKR
ncbi:glycosyltransferase, partial [Candidatus Omnitrophota bacterium]